MMADFCFWTALIACTWLATVNGSTVKTAGDWWRFIHLFFFSGFVLFTCNRQQVQSKGSAHTFMKADLKLSQVRCFTLTFNFFVYPARVFKYSWSSLSQMSVIEGKMKGQFLIFCVSFKSICYFRIKLWKLAHHFLHIKLWALEDIENGLSLINSYYTQSDAYKIKMPVIGMMDLNP